MIEIEILNWDVMNKKRADVKNPSWFRLELDFPQSQSLHGLTAAERYVFLSLLCLAGKKQTGKLMVEPAWFCHWAGGCFGTEEFTSAIEKLKSGSVPALTVHVRTRTRTLRARTHAGVTDGRTDGQDTAEVEPTSGGSPPSLSEEEFVKSKNIPLGVVAGWNSLYEPDFMKREVRKAMNWCANNPRKVPRSNWGQFFSGWFERSWEKYRKSIPTNKPTKTYDFADGVA